jgi:CRP/FNR family cyclic AMP-dependent transcriptional regulator
MPKFEAPGPLWGLRRFAVLSELPDAALHALADAATSRQCSRGALLHVLGEPADAVYCLRGGRVSALWEPSEGQTINIGEFGPGDIFGETCLWTAPAVRDDTSIVTSPALLTVVPRVAFREVLDQHPRVERALVSQSIARREAIRRRLCDALNLSVRARVVDHLVRLAEAGHTTPEGRKFSIGRQRELAALVVCTRESASLELARLERERLIIRTGREVVVPDLDRLRAAARKSGSPKANSPAFSRLSSSSPSASAP